MFTTFSAWTLDFLSKAAGHKYIRRIPYASGGKTRYRYIYKVTHTAGGKHALHEDDVTVGAAFMLGTDKGAEVHAHVKSVNGDKVTVEYDDGPRKGEKETMSKRDLLSKLDAAHGISAALQGEREKQAKVISELRASGASEKQIAREQARLDRLGGDKKRGGGANVAQKYVDSVDILFDKSAPTGQMQGQIADIVRAQKGEGLINDRVLGVPDTDTKSGAKLGALLTAEQRKLAQEWQNASDNPEVSATMRGMAAFLRSKYNVASQQDLDNNKDTIRQSAQLLIDAMLKQATARMIAQYNETIDTTTDYARNRIQDATTDLRANTDISTEERETASSALLAKQKEYAKLAEEYRRKPPTDAVLLGVLQASDFRTPTYNIKDFTEVVPRGDDLARAVQGVVADALQAAYSTNKKTTRPKADRTLLNSARDLVREQPNKYSAQALKAIDAAPEKYTSPTQIDLGFAPIKVNKDRPPVKSAVKLYSVEGLPADYAVVIRNDGDASVTLVKEGHPQQGQSVVMFPASMLNEPSLRTALAAFPPINNGVPALGQKVMDLQKLVSSGAEFEPHKLAYDATR